MRLWIDVGLDESARAVNDARRLSTLLSNLAPRGLDMRYVEARGAGHNEAAWASRLPRALRYLFG